MKKILTIICIILTLSLVGCSQQTTSQKSEEEIRAEIKAEMEAEAKQKAEVEAEKQAAQKPEEKREPAQQVNPPETSTNSQTDNVQQPVLLKSYEINREYKYDLDGNQKIDTFSLETDSNNYINLFVNEWGYSVALEGISPELLYGKYKLLNIDGKQIITLFVAAPPNDYEIYFYEYADLGYSKNESEKKETEELLKLTVFTVDLGEFNHDFSTLLNANMELRDDGIIIGDKAFPFWN